MGFIYSAAPPPHHGGKEDRRIGLPVSVHVKLLLRRILITSNTWKPLDNFLQEDPVLLYDRGRQMVGEKLLMLTLYSHAFNFNPAVPRLVVTGDS